MVERITCKGFRGFQETGVLELAIPHDNKCGSGLTILVGPNGGGKSTLVETFSRLSSTNDVSFTEGKRNKNAGDLVAIEVSYNGLSGKLCTVQEGGSETSWVGPRERPKIYSLPSRRVFNPYFSRGTLDRNAYMRNPEIMPYRASSLNNFTYRLFDVNKNQDKFKRFNEVLWKILGKKLEWTIDQDDNGQYYLKVKKDSSIYHNSDGLGEGVVSLLFIVDALYDAKEDELIVIDEPELSLHPQLQVRLLNEIMERTKSIQVVIATHSPNMLSIEAAINGGVIARVYEDHKGSHIKSIDDNCRKFFMSFENNLHNPHIVGSDARSCFFIEDGLIITEGQEDVMLYPKVLDQLGFRRGLSFFGFGAGGANNIEKIAYIMQSLGFSKISAIFDGDKQNEFDNFNRLYPAYKAWIIPTEDIRDKEEYSRTAKKGLLDKDLQIKEEFKPKINGIMRELVAWNEMS